MCTRVQYTLHTCTLHVYTARVHCTMLFCVLWRVYTILLCILRNTQYTLYTIHDTRYQLQVGEQLRGMNLVNWERAPFLR